MKSFLRAAAATGVAAATLAAGLSFGPATASAAQSVNAGHYVGERLATIQLIAKLDNGQYAYLGTNKRRVVTSSLSSAKSSAQRLTPIYKGEYYGAARWGFLWDGRSNACFAGWYGGDTAFTSSNTGCSTGWHESWAVRSGQLVAIGGATSTPSEWFLTSALGPEVNGNPGIFATSRERPVKSAFVDLPLSALSNLTATATNINVESGTASLDGTAPSDADAVDVTYTNKNGRQVTLNADVKGGRWNADLTNLALGKTAIRLEAFAGADPLADADAEVTLPVTPLTAAASFPPDVTKSAVISGTATTSTEIRVYHGETLVGTTTTSAGDGKYSVAVKAPGMAGNYDLTVKQVIRNQEATPTEVSIAYGAGVAVTSPADGIELGDGDALTIAGTAQGGSPVTIYEKGKPAAPLGTATTSTTSGTWRVPGLHLEDRQYELVAAATSKGNNVTTATLTVNPGKSTIANPTASAKFDADVSKKATVSGTGVDGATITVKEGTKVLGTATIANGTWSTTIDAIGAGKHTLTIEQTGIDGTQSTTADIDYGTAVTVTAPAPSTKSEVALSGTGTDGARVSFVDDTGATRTTTVKDGKWELTGKFADGTKQVTVTSLSRGALTTTAIASVRVDQVRLPVVVTSPTVADAQAGKIKPGLVTFAGTATPFAEVKMELWSGGRVLFTSHADADGKWSGTGGLAETTYTPVITQTVKGTSDTTVWATFSTTDYKNLSAVRPAAGDVMRPSKTWLSGKGTALADIAVYTGPKEASWSRKIWSGTTDSDGTFGGWASLSANTTYTLFTYQSKGTDADYVMNQVETGAEMKDVAGVSATNVGQTTTITGTAQPGATVEFWTGPKDATWGPRLAFTATADNYGEFSASGYLTPGTAYTLFGYEQWGGSYFGNSTTFQFTPTA